MREDRRSTHHTRLQARNSGELLLSEAPGIGGLNLREDGGVDLGGIALACENGSSNAVSRGVLSRDRGATAAGDVVGVEPDGHAVEPGLHLEVLAIDVDTLVVWNNCVVVAHTAVAAALENIVHCVLKGTTDDLELTIAVTADSVEGSGLRGAGTIGVVFNLGAHSRESWARELHSVLGVLLAQALVLVECLGLAASGALSVLAVGDCNDVFGGHHASDRDDGEENSTHFKECSTQQRKTDEAASLNSWERSSRQF